MTAMIRKRTVKLPSGRSIEVVYHDTKHEPEPVDDLSVCPECDRDLVYPVDWEEAEVDRFAEALKRGLVLPEDF